MLGISYHQFVDQLIARIPVHPGDRVLDVATGTGVIPLRLARQLSSACAITGLDITPAMLLNGQARARAAGLSSLFWPVCASGMEMPFSDRAFDVVTCGLGMHHMEGERLVREMRRVLRPGGWLVMADVAASPFWRSRFGAFWLRWLMFYFGITHSRVRLRAEVEALANLLTGDEWQAVLAACGFVEVHIARLRSRHRYYPEALLISARCGGA
jgi:ubiquinone/menaquinone biosynthesis C-methylase UbiE